MDGGDEGSPPPSDVPHPIPAAAAVGVGDGRSPLVAPGPSRWFIFADAQQGRLPALLAVATRAVLDDIGLGGFTLSSTDGDAFAVRRDARSGPNPGGEMRNSISWFVVTRCRATSEDAAAAASPYVVVSTRTRDRSWRASVLVATDERQNGGELYDIDVLDGYVQASLREFFGTLDDDGGGYRVLAVRNDATDTFHIFFELSVSGEIVQSGGGGVIRGAEAAERSSSRLHCKRPRFQEQRRVAGVIWRSRSSSRPPSEHRRRRWDQAPAPLACSSCPRIQPEYHIGEDCVIGGAIKLRRSGWQQFSAIRRGFDVWYCFYNLEDVRHRRDTGIRFQMHRYEAMLGSRSWRRFHCTILRYPCPLPMCIFSFPPFVDHTPPLVSVVWRWMMSRRSSSSA
uniref:Uncharacterized protein n=1 Tax=Leersia perrieri TaxID=77586 RepID=A0A0D9XGU3_9ORYZ